MDPYEKYREIHNSEKKGIMDNYEKYREFTISRNWEGICSINGVELDSFGTKKELGVLPTYLEEGEVVFALTSGIVSQTKTSNATDFGPNTWLVTLTNERFLFLDCAMLSSSVDIQSARHEYIQAVSASQGWMYGKISVDLGNRMIVIDNCKKETVNIMAKLANQWVRELKEKKAQAQQQPVQVTESSLDKLEKLANLLSIGALTQEEFNSAKAKILESL